ncbi:MAG: hypothetical protein HFACDABA_03008 [Anaerolineales bacterium]|nr:hypothetical protein [Anaerolineales bacterium]
MLIVTLYTRKECKLCEEVKGHLAEIHKDIPHRLAEVDIESDPALKKTYSEKIPVLEIGPYTLVAPITKEQLKMTLGAASDRHGQLKRVGGEAYEKRVRRGQQFTTADRVSFWMSKHYLALTVFMLLVYVGLPFLAPALMKAGAEAPARALYVIYSPLCHQFGFRSFFLFGEQPYYPLAEANMQGVKTFDEVSGLQDLSNPSSFSRLEARRFIGDETTGYKVALCERDVAIYLGLMFFALIFGASGRKIPPLHWSLWLILAIGPIGLDGFSQLFSQFNLAWLASLVPYRESTPFLRALTGALFGFGTAWFSIPYMEESMAETRQLYLKKFAGSKS